MAAIDWRWLWLRIQLEIWLCGSSAHRTKCYDCIYSFPHVFSLGYVRCDCVSSSLRATQRHEKILAESGLSISPAIGQYTESKTTYVLLLQFDPTSYSDILVDEDERLV